MPLDKFVLIIVVVIAAAGATVWIGATVIATSGMGWPVLAVLLPVALVAYVIWRVVADRLSNREDDHYDRIEK